MELKSRNPFLNNKSFTQEGTTIYNTDGSPVTDYTQVMTIRGTVSKSFILLGLLIAGAFFAVYMAATGMNVLAAGIGSAIIGFVLVLVATFTPKNSQYLAPAYALFEGVFVGTVSLIIEAAYPQRTGGIVLQAVLGTIITLGVCLTLYSTGIIKVGQQFKSIVLSATLAIGTYYLISMICYWGFNISFFHRGNSLISIGFSIVVIVLAAMNLILDFSLIEEGAAKKLPKYMEWYSGMGLIITLVWLYLEFLKLLSKLQSRN